MFDTFLEKMNRGPIKALGFADDVSLRVMGIHPMSLIDIMQNALKEAIIWGKQHSLKFVPEKTVAIFFTKKRKFSPPKKLKIDKVTIEYSKVTKYLGVFLDEKLNWRYHIQQKIASAKKLIYTIRNAIGKIYGPRPQALKWAYNAMVVPKISWASIVWAKTCQTNTIRRKFTSLNRLMALTMMPAREKTPTHGLEIILDLVPIDLKIKELALKAMLRVLPQSQTRWNGIGNSSSIGHMKWGQDELNKIGIPKKAFDTTNALNLNPKYKCDLESFNSGKPVSETSINCYTDGSKILNKTGYGFGIAEDKVIISRDNGSLNDNCTVFQAETVAIEQASIQLQEMGVQKVTIFSDSRAAISSLAALKIKSQTVAKCIDKLNLLGSQCEVTIKWVKAHNNHPGNEYADMEAKLGTSNQDNKMAVLPPISWARGKITQLTYKDWTKRWKSYEKARQTKIWFPSAKVTHSRVLLKCNRQDLGLAVAMITGHNCLKRHETIIDPDGDSLCRLCGEEEETSWHIIGECPALWKVRLDTFQQLQMENPPRWKVSQLLTFLRKAGLQELNKGEGNLHMPQHQIP